jgi:hypothetical protein
VQQPQLAHRHTRLRQPVAALVALPYALGLARVDGAAIGVEGIRIDRRRQTKRPRNQVIFLRLFAAFFLALFDARDLGADLLDAVATIRRDGGREFVARAGLRAPVVRKLREPGARTLFVESPVGNPLVE